jgi:tRNA G37 N-methylase Trm5
MFAGAGPFPIVIAKNSGAKVVFSNEINKEANKYGRLNAELNKVKNKIVFVDGDIKKVVKKWNIGPKKFDVIVMPRPQLKDSFLEQAFALSKKGTRIFYYDFCPAKEIYSVVEKIQKEAKKYKKKIKILKVKPAGEIAPYKIRVRVDFVVD